MQNLSSSISDSGESIYTKERNPENILLVVITSNRGLCGGFNSNIIKTTLTLLTTTYAVQQQKGGVSLITIGRKGSEYFRKRGYKVVESHDDLFDRLTFSNVSLLAEQLMKSFADKHMTTSRSFTTSSKMLQSSAWSLSPIFRSFLRRPIPGT